MGNFIDSIQSFYENNTEISIAIAVAIIVALVIKPKQAGKIAGAIVILLVAGFLVLEVVNIAGSTMDRKSEAAHRTDNQLQQSEAEGN